MDQSSQTLIDLTGKFFEQSKRFEELKEQMKEVKQEMTATMNKLGIGTHFQDPADGTVFMIVKPTGTFISFDEVGYERTKRMAEAKGSMSMKKAQELGYNL